MERISTFRIDYTIPKLFIFLPLQSELAMLPSTYEIVYEEQAEETKTVQKDAEVVEWNSDSQIYWKILEADPEQIHFKSRLLTMLKR